MVHKVDGEMRFGARKGPVVHKTGAQERKEELLRHSLKKYPPARMLSNGGLIYIRDLLQPKILQGSRDWSFWKRFALFELLHDYLNGFVQLLVNALLLLDRVVVNKDVRVYAVVLNNPLAGFGVVVCEERYADVGAVHVWK